MRMYTHGATDGVKALGQRHVPLARGKVFAAGQDPPHAGRNGAVDDPVHVTREPRVIKVRVCVDHARALSPSRAEDAGTAAHRSSPGRQP